jgi:hypothetical protein
MSGDPTRKEAKARFVSACDVIDDDADHDDFSWILLNVLPCFVDQSFTINLLLLLGFPTKSFFVFLVSATDVPPV